MVATHTKGGGLKGWEDIISKNGGATETIGVEHGVSWSKQDGQREMRTLSRSKLLTERELTKSETC